LQIVDESSSCRQNTFGAVLRSSTFLGDQFVYEAFVKELVVMGKSRLVPTRDDRRLQLYVDPAEIMVFPHAECKDRVLAPEHPRS
ncbi:MAG TPA: hypothetical protein VIG57_02235, partial [Candidatus Entotheonella sp.]